MTQLVYVMMSGGVDSSVAAAVLKEQGYEVRGVFMQCWSEEQLIKLGLDPSEYACAWDEDAKDAEWVAKKLDIPFEIWDLREEYFQNVVSYMVEEYKHGKTPNPDVMCNSFIKFGVFTDKALQSGADFVATGHYARVIHSDKYNKKLIARGLDSHKDQSYFLARVNSNSIEKILFPIGEFSSKSEVRKKASELDLITADKPDSQGICFIGDTPLREILLKTLGKKPGAIIELKTDKEPKTIGGHDGAFLYTIGQRHGLGLSGGPWFVHSIDINQNVVYVVQESEIHAIESRGLAAHSPNWFVDPTTLTDTTAIDAQVRYRQHPTPSFVTNAPDGFSLIFNSPTRAIAPGQIAALYDGDVLIGSGIISK